ncbi:MAG: hypothetical protein Rhob2KO_54000 [Rhodopirellula baltica]
MQRRTGGQFSRMEAQLPVPADPGRSANEEFDSMLASTWSRFLEFCTVGGFVLGVVLIPIRDLKFAFAGAAVASLVLVLVFEIRRTRDQRRYTANHEQMIKDLRERDLKIQEQAKMLETSQDPELTRIYREDEEARLRLQRESMENIMRSNQSQRDALSRVADSFTDSIRKPG